MTVQNLNYALKAITSRIIQAGVAMATGGRRPIPHFGTISITGWPNECFQKCSDFGKDPLVIAVPQYLTGRLFDALSFRNMWQTESANLKRCAVEYSRRFCESRKILSITLWNRHRSSIYFLCLGGILTAQQTDESKKVLAPTPPMGWNSHE